MNPFSCILSHPIFAICLQGVISEWVSCTKPHRYYWQGSDGNPSPLLCNPTPFPLEPSLITWQFLRVHKLVKQTIDTKWRWSPSEHNVQRMLGYTFIYWTLTRQMDGTWQKNFYKFMIFVNIEQCCEKQNRALDSSQNSRVLGLLVLGFSTSNDLVIIYIISDMFTSETLWKSNEMLHSPKHMTFVHHQSYKCSVCVCRINRWACDWHVEQHLPLSVYVVNVYTVYTCNYTSTNWWNEYALSYLIHLCACHRNIYFIDFQMYVYRIKQN